jgi:hypothetical protein
LEVGRVTLGVGRVTLGVGRGAVRVAGLRRMRRRMR